MTIVVACLAALMLVSAAGYRLWAVLYLLSHYRVDEYTATPRAKAIFVGATASVFAMLAAIVVLAFCTTIRWVEVCAWVLATAAMLQIAWKIYLRRSGKYVAIYKSRNWR